MEPIKYHPCCSFLCPAQALAEVTPNRPQQAAVRSASAEQQGSLREDVLLDRAAQVIAPSFKAPSGNVSYWQIAILALFVLSVKTGNLCGLGSLVLL